MTDILLIDAENLSYRHSRSISLIADSAVIRRAYGDWTLPTLRSWKRVLDAHHILPMQTSHTPTRKNSADIAIAYDLAVLHSELKLRTVFLASNDGDFRPVVERLEESSVEVVGIIDSPTRPKVPVFSTYYNVRYHSMVPVEIREAFLAVAARLLKSSKWIRLSAFADAARDALGASFDFKRYGYTKFVDFIRALKLFELRHKAEDYFIRLTRSMRKHQLAVAA